jgi:hypothetical protein
LWGASIGYITEAVTRRLTRQVFQIRLLDSVVGVAALAAGLAAGFSPNATPWLLATGSIYSVLRSRRLALSTRPDTGARQPVLRRPAATPFMVSRRAR